MYNEGFLFPSVCPVFIGLFLISSLVISELEITLLNLISVYSFIKMRMLFNQIISMKVMVGSFLRLV